MRIDRIDNCNQRNQTFGHKFAESMFDTHRKVLPYYAAKIKLEQDEVAYYRYIDALKAFVKSSFDATNIVTDYGKKAKELGEHTLKEFRSVLYEMKFPRIEEKSNLPWAGYDIKKLEAEVSIPNSFLEGDSLLCDFGFHHKTTKISETEEQFLKDDKGILDLTNMVNEGIEQGLRKEFENAIKKGIEAKNKEDFNAAMEKEILAMKRQGITF